MKDLKTEKKKLKIHRIIRWSFVALFFIALGMLINKQETLKTTGAALIIISIPAIIITKKITQKQKETVKQIEIIKIGNEEANKKEN